MDISCRDEDGQLIHTAKNIVASVYIQSKPLHLPGELESVKLEKTDY
jgi:hypothetical protein